jgi:hypothetical protein
VWFAKPFDLAGFYIGTVRLILVIVKAMEKFLLTGIPTGMYYFHKCRFRPPPRSFK